MNWLFYKGNNLKMSIILSIPLLFIFLACCFLYEGDNFKMAVILSVPFLFIFWVCAIRPNDDNTSARSKKFFRSKSDRELIATRLKLREQLEANAKHNKKLDKWYFILIYICIISYFIVLISDTAIKQICYIVCIGVAVVATFLKWFCKPVYALEDEIKIIDNEVEKRKNDGEEATGKEPFSFSRLIKGLIKMARNNK
ncbi:MAG: hypothetical protein LBU73_03130 [Helicobacteraceae bacterium]|nr:hypothetical protein [Helicobacteraceae bacterium]